MNDNNKKIKKTGSLLLVAILLFTSVIQGNGLVMSIKANDIVQEVAEGKTYYVSSNGTFEGDGSKENPLPRLYNAVMKASDGDTIELLDDVDLKSVDGGLRETFIDKDLTINGNGHTLFRDVNNASIPLINVENEANVHFENITIEMRKNVAKSIIDVNENASVTLAEDVILKGNVYVNNGLVTVNSGSFQSNGATFIGTRPERADVVNLGGEVSGTANISNMIVPIDTEFGLSTLSDNFYDVVADKLQEQMPDVELVDNAGFRIFPKGSEVSFTIEDSFEDVSNMQIAYIPLQIHHNTITFDENASFTFKNYKDSTISLSGLDLPEATYDTTYAYGLIFVKGAEASVEPEPLQYKEVEIKEGSPVADCFNTETKWNTETKKDGEAAWAFDKNPATVWHSEYKVGSATNHGTTPHWISWDLEKAYKIGKLRYDSNENGRFENIKIYVSTDAKAEPAFEDELDKGKWELAAEYSCENVDSQEIVFTPKEALKVLIIVETSYAGSDARNKNANAKEITTYALEEESGAVDKSELQALYDEYCVLEGINSKFTSYLEEAEAILENPNATQEEVEEIVSNLKDCYLLYVCNGYISEYNPKNLDYSKYSTESALAFVKVYMKGEALNTVVIHDDAQREDIKKCVEEFEALDKNDLVEIETPRGIMMGVSEDVTPVVKTNVGFFNISETQVKDEDGNSMIQLHIEYHNDGKHPISRLENERYTAYSKNEIKNMSVYLDYQTYSGSTSGSNPVSKYKQALNGDYTNGFEMDVLVEPGTYVVRLDSVNGTRTVGTYYTNEIVHQHNAVKVEAKEETCTEDGNIEYWYCEDCDTYFSDEALTTPITLEETIIKATGHNYENGSCTECGAKDPDYTEPADKEALSEVIDEANALDLDLYTKESVEALLEALNEAKAVLEDDAATQEEVDEATKALTDAIDALEMAEVNKEILEYAITLAEKVTEEDLEDCVDAVVEYFNKALANAREVCADEKATKAEVTEAWTTLFDAMHKLDWKKADVSILKDFVEYADTLVKEDYYESAWAKFEEALAAAKELIADGNNMDQEAVNTTLKELMDAASELRSIPDKSELEDLITKVEGMKAEDYTAASWAAVEAALANAKAIYNAESSEAEVNAAKARLEEAVKGLQENPIPTEKGKLNEVIEKAEALDKKKYTAESFKVLEEALQVAKAVAKDENATQEEVEEALAKLTVALDDLQPVEPTDSEEDKKPTTPDTETGTDTGDSTNVGGLLTLLGLAGVAIAYETRKRMR